MQCSANTFKAVCLASLLLVATPVQATTEPCVREIAAHFDVDLRLVKAILRVEGGRVGMRQPNTNGTHDLGPMQINTLWLPKLRERGIDEHALVWDYCTNVAVGTWILARELRASRAEPNTAEFWRAVGRYHSRTPRHNVRYAVRVWHRAQQIQP